MSMADDVRDVLAADTTLAALLTGGVYADVEEISRQGTPGAFDANKELLPCALVKVGTEAQRGPYSRSTQASLMVYFYQRSGYDVLEPAMDRAFELLHEQKIGTRTFQILHDTTIHTHELVEREQSALEASMGLMRFIWTRYK